MLGSRAKAKLYVHRLRRAGWVYSFPSRKTGTYRLQAPEVCVLLQCGKIRGLANLINEEYAGLLGAYVTSVIGNVKGLRSLVLYGSVARGKARKESDLDLLAIIDDRESLRDVFNEMIELTGKGAPGSERSYLSEHGMYRMISILPMSVSRLQNHPFIMLDIATEGVILYDDGAFESEATRIKRRLNEIGAKRVDLGQNGWYWDLMPHYSEGALVQV